MLDMETTKAAILERLIDLELPMSVTLGRTTLPIAEMLKLTSGSILELDRQVGEFVDLTIHGTLVARGEIVSVNGNYGVRIKEIISQQDRLAFAA
jgi:flagellar motor switch protein FliN/FliY